MKKLIATTFVSMAFLVILPSANAQILPPYGTEGSRSGIVGDVVSNDHTAGEEMKGLTIWKKLQNKETDCPSLSDDDFDSLGEYFMGKMMGNSHAAMNQMMVTMMGKEGEKHTHIVMGKRLSGCDISAAFTSQGVGVMPMMQMMWGGRPLMNFSNGSGVFGWFVMLLWWVLIIVAVVALIKWLINQFNGRTSHKTALDILKERYAKGEIDKNEFEEKSKKIK